MSEGLNERDRIMQRWSSLQSERLSWIAHWKEISEFLLPRSGRFFAHDRNKGARKHNKIYDSTGSRSLRTLAAGMMAGMTSPARPWFRLTTSDPELDEAGAVKIWLADTTRLMQMVFAKSNTYRALHSCYEELGAFGTASTIILPNYDNVIHHTPLTVGEYAISTDEDGMVDTLYREFDMTVWQLVEKFGLEKCSPTVRGLYERHTFDAWVTVIHCIEPREMRDVRKRDAKNMPFRSVYLEAAASRALPPLSESGFKRFPALCPRWAVSGGDIYGNCPGMEALGHVKGLQHEQVRKAEGIDYQTKPPLQMPTSLSDATVNKLPGGSTFVDMASPTGGIKPMFEVNLNLSHLLADIQDVREQIRQSFYADLFLMLANDERSGTTAYEVAQRHEEKLMMLGPVIERLHSEILSPKVEMTFAYMIEAGIVPPVPPELEGRELNVEYISMLAQAQRAVATNGIDRFVASLGAVAQFKPNVLDKFDSDKWADMYADALGVDPNLIVTGDQVTLIRNERAKMQQAAAQAEQMQAMSQAAKNLGSINTDQSNALTDVTRNLTGYT